MESIIILLHNLILKLLTIPFLEEAYHLLVLHRVVSPHTVPQSVKYVRDRFFSNFSMGLRNRALYHCLQFSFIFVVPHLGKLRMEDWNVTCKKKLVQWSL